MIVSHHRTCRFKRQIAEKAKARPWSPRASFFLRSL